MPSSLSHQPIHRARPRCLSLLLRCCITLLLPPNFSCQPSTGPSRRGPHPIPLTLVSRTLRVRATALRAAVQPGTTTRVSCFGLMRLFDAYAAKLPVAEVPVASGDDVMDLVLRHYPGGSSGLYTSRFEAAIRSVQYGPAGDVIAAGDAGGCIHLICAQTGAKILCVKGHR